MDFLSSTNNVMWLIWLAVGVGFILAELMAPGFVVIFFGIGALLAGATAFFGSSIQLQLIVFTVSSLVLLLLLRRYMSTIFHGSSSKGDDIEGETDHAIGAQAEVVETIDPPKRGRIKFQGTFWTAESTETIEAGALVKILSRHHENNNILIVQKEN
ncbi:NfeD family protein [Pseudodesulfovibrio sp. zrk46]|uniref:NfeD family protein n=1 Tax=Pseudodesulfovibrio sp. zrk46 TaxID=2725288 RepID=UPI0014491EF9|nr:NfeD family protein [Pseudodesulfovibrio sp. zrk46]QJB55911.1 NfeD family protein [Pseudodesulfovibrio sp. zrk46]